MYKREMKVYLKSFLIWTIITMVMYVCVFAIYPSIMNNSSKEMIDEILKMYPPDVLKAFNMDIVSIDTAFGWLKTEGFIFILLITGAFAGTLGSNILVKEESEKTIEYLNSLPVKRNKIVTSKLMSALTYIVAMIACFGLFNFIGLSLSCDFDKKQYVLLSITPLFSSIVIFALCLFISTFTHKTKKMRGISLGIVFGSYIIQTIAGLSDKVENLKYLSAFTLADTRNVINDERINPIIVLVTVALFAIFTVLTYIRYNKKELV